MDINAPRHYGDTKLMDLLVEKKVPFAEGNVMKYVFRWESKDGLKDLYKARDYLNAIITHAELKHATQQVVEVTPSIFTAQQSLFKDSNAS